MIDEMRTTRFDEIAIVQREARLWRYHIDEHDVGPHFKTRGEAVEYIDQYAAEYGLTPGGGPMSYGAAIVRAIETIDHCYLDPQVIKALASDLRGVLNERTKS